MLSAGRDGLCAHSALRAATQVQLNVRGRLLNGHSITPNHDKRQGLIAQKRGG